MNWLAILELSINSLLSILGQLKPETSAADAKVASEITAAIERLQAVRNDVVSLAELESIRTKTLW